MWFGNRVVYGEDVVRGAILAGGGMAAINLCLIFAGGNSAAQNLGYDFIYVVVVLAYGLPWRAGVIACLGTTGLTAAVAVLFPAPLPATICGFGLVLFIRLRIVGGCPLPRPDFQLPNPPRR